MTATSEWSARIRSGDVRSLAKAATEIENSGPQANAEQAQADTPLPDQRTETDEMFQNAGEKR